MAHLSRSAGSRDRHQDDQAAVNFHYGPTGFDEIDETTSIGTDPQGREFIVHSFLSTTASSAQ
jgi:hypothetical protein